MGESLNSVKVTLKTNNHNWPSIEGLPTFNCVFCVCMWGGIP